MNKYDIIQSAEYTDIILDLISKYHINSLTKIIFLAFIVKNREFTFESTSRRFGLEKQLFLGFESYYWAKNGDFKSIFNALNILEKAHIISVDFDCVNMLKYIKRDNSNDIMKSKMFEKMMAAMKNISDESFMKEVLENV